MINQRNTVYSEVIIKTKKQIMFNNSDKIKELKKELKLLNGTMIGVKEECLKRAPDFEKDAKQASKRTSEFRNRAKETKEQVDQLKQEADSTISAISALHAQVSTKLDEARGILVELEASKETANELSSSLQLKEDSISSSIEKIEAVLEEHPELEDEVDVLEEKLKDINENSAKINTLLKGVNSKKVEIDELYYEIVGYVDEDEETGKKVVVDGLKKELENQYNNIETNLSMLSGEVDELKKSTENKIESFVNEKETESENLLSNWERKLQGLEKQIQQLLPNALTAGLSAAFQNKRLDEENTLGSMQRQFNWGIFGLVIISIIPFVISLSFLLNGETWDKVINWIPRIVLAITPLYTPVLWLAIVANKKMNLSKRLIEEYTHKEVLSKTYEGLVTQIKNLENESDSEQLKAKLLSDFLKVYSENPGKLISNYESSDHPLMDILSKTDNPESVDSATQSLIRKIPGVDILTEKISGSRKEGVAIGVDKALNGPNEVSE